MTPLWPLAFSAVIFILPVGYFVWLWALYRRPPVTDVSVVAEYAPPAGVNVVEAAYLLDGALKPRAVAALLVEMKLRGVLEIVEDDRGRVAAFRLPSGGPAPRYEEEAMLDVIFSGGEDEVPFSDADARMEEALAHLQRDVKEHLRKRGLLGEPPWPPMILFAAAVGAALTVSASLLPILDFRLVAGIFGASVLLAELAYVAATWRPPLSAEGKKVVLHLMGFRTFLTQVEGDYLQWQERIEKEPSVYTPYAIVFGITLSWATKLQRLTDALLKHVLP